MFSIYVQGMSEKGNFSFNSTDNFSAAIDLAAVTDISPEYVEKICVIMGS